MEPNEALPGAFATQESQQIRERRTSLNLSAAPPVVGLALSGGGIRSATFALGLLQSLAKARILRRIDYLSTVSGGGYIGSFLGALFARQSPAGVGQTAGATRAANVEVAIADLSGWLVRWLRENGRYLSPNGAGDTLLGAVVALRNWVAVHLVLGTLALTIFLGLDIGRWWMSDSLRLADDLVAGRIWWSPTVALPLLMLVAWVVPSGWAYWLVPPPPSDGTRGWRDWLPLATGIGLCAFELWAWLTGRCATDSILYDLQLAAWVATLLALAALLIAALNTGLNAARMQHDLSIWLRNGLIFTVALVVLALIDSLGETFYVVAQGKGVGRWLAPVPLALSAIATLGQKLLSMGGGTRRNQRIQPQWGAVAMLAAVLIGGLELVSISAAGHALVWRGQAPPQKIVQGVLPSASKVEVALSADRHIVIPPLECPAGAPETTAPERTSTTILGAVLLGLLFLCWSFGRTRSFMNQSSLASLYAARLRRAYLGASNQLREEDRSQKGVTRDVDGDDLAFADYRPWVNGGPLHLINVTLNETVSGESQIEQRDRKGLPMAFGPAGVSVGVRHHGTWVRAKEHPVRIKPVVDDTASAQFRVFDPKAEPIEPERLTLSRLVAISGAAVSTGLGSRTSLGLSALLGLFNVRLGHWWQSGVDPKLRRGAEIYSRKRIWNSLGQLFSRMFSVQAHLLDEILARFHGPSRRNWNLTDGGHFENTGCYELIRRRVPLIVVSDSGADPDYAFEDFAQLVRKARLDFGAVIRCATPAELMALDPGVRHLFGDLEQIRGKSPAPESDGRRWNGAHAALVYVEYSDTAARSTLLWIKPSLVHDTPTGSSVPRAPEDVVRYAVEHPFFPQEPTSDQYFDEAQWESYRRLGEYIGDLLFGGGDGGAAAGTWRPRDLDPSVSATVGGAA